MSKVRHTILLKTAIRDFLIGTPNSIMISAGWKSFYIIIHTRAKPYQQVISPRNI